MFRKKIYPENIYLSFVVDNKLVPEYIPKRTKRISYWIHSKYVSLLLFFGQPIYYWNLRYMFVPDIRKKEDIKFIFHVLEVHEGEPKLYREKLAYNRLCALYKQELDILLIPKYFADVEKEPITHMYARAYFKRWIQKPSSEWKLTYHGLDFNELLDSEIMAIDIMKKELKSMDNRYNYYKNKLKKK